MSNENIIYTPVIILEIGSLQVYSFQTQQDVVLGVKPIDFYWTDRRYSNRVGPFPSLNEAVSNYNSQYKSLGSNSNNVIIVDFKAKKRISPKG